LYESEARRAIPEVIDFLHQLAYWLGNRQISFPRGQERIVIEIPDDVELEIEIEEEDEGKGKVKRSLEIEIEWIEEKAAPAGARAIAGAEGAAKDMDSD
jgi:amphi-Trp domain-containing protein